MRHFFRIDKRCIFNTPDDRFSKPLQSVFFILGVIPLEKKTSCYHLGCQKKCLIQSRKYQSCDTTMVHPAKLRSASYKLLRVFTYRSFVCLFRMMIFAPDLSSFASWMRSPSPPLRFLETVEDKQSAFAFKWPYFGTILLTWFCPVWYSILL